MPGSMSKSLRLAGLFVLLSSVLAVAPMDRSASSRVPSSQASASSTRTLLLDLASEARLWNGYFELREFEKYDAADAAEALEQFSPDTRYCGFATVNQASDALTRLKLEDAPTAQKVRDLLHPGLIRALVLREPVRGEREYCSTYSFAIFTRDGLVLFLHYDFTT